MRIVCPECGFERELDPTKIPASAVMATCPQCELRFRFRSLTAPPLPSDDPTRSRPPMLSDLADPDDSSEAYPEQPASAESPLSSRSSVTIQPAPPTPSVPSVQDGDDPLPPGAIIPTAPATPLRPQDADGADALRPGGHGGREARDKNGSPHDSNSAQRGDEKATADTSDAPRTAAWDARSLFSGTGASDIPWETAPPAELPQAWYHTMLRALFSAPVFFTSVGASRSGLIRPCLFFVLLGTFQSVVDHLWFMSRLSEWAAMQDANVQAGISAFSQNLNLPLLMLFMPLMLLAQLLFYAGMFNLMIRLVQPDKADFITTIRVIAYSAAPGVLSLVPLVGTQIAGLWFAVCCFIGVKHALDLSWPRAALAILPLYVLGLALSLHAARLLMSVAQQ